MSNQQFAIVQPAKYDIDVAFFIENIGLIGYPDAQISVSTTNFGRGQRQLDVNLTAEATEAEFSIIISSLDTEAILVAVTFAAAFNEAIIEKVKNEARKIAMSL